MDISHVFVAFVGLKDFRDFLSELEHFKEVVRVSEPVSTDYDMTAYWLEAEKVGNPVLLFENVMGYDMPVVVNVFGSRERVSRMIGASVHDFYNKWIEKSRQIIEPEIVSDGPVKQMKFYGEDVRLDKLPAQKFFLEDAGRYITAGIVVANHPETGTTNLSFARMMLKGKNKLGISIHSRGYLWNYFQSAVELGRPWLEVAVVLGCHPVIHLAAASRTFDEYRLAGALAGEPVTLLKCETKDLYIPSNAEIVLEGRILTEVNEDEGPFSEYTGYLTGRSTRNVLIIDCLTRRRDAIFHSIIPSNSSEHLNLGGLPMQAHYYRKLKESVPQVRNIYFPSWGTHFVAILSVDKRGKEGIQIRAALFLMGENPYVKYVIVVDDDIDVFDERQVFWAFATRTQPNKNIHLIPVTDGNMLDPSQEKPGIISRAIIDATRPTHWQESGVIVPSIPTEAANRAKKMFKYLIKE